MLKRINNGYELTEGITLTKEQQERFDEIKSLPAGFMPDYEQYIFDGSMPSPVDEEGNKKNLAVHPMRDLMIESKINRVEIENKRLSDENAKLRNILVEKTIITSKEADELQIIEKEDELIIKR